MSRYDLSVIYQDSFGAYVAGTLPSTLWQIKMNKTLLLIKRKTRNFLKLMIFYKNQA